MLRQLKVLLLLPILAACSGEAETARPGFRTAVETHLEAVAGRDLESLKSTLTLNDGDLQVIFPVAFIAIFGAVMPFTVLLCLLGTQ